MDHSGLDRTSSSAGSSKSSSARNSSAVSGSSAAAQSRHQSQYEYVDKDPEFMGRDGDKVIYTRKYK